MATPPVLGPTGTVDDEVLVPDAVLVPDPSALAAAPAVEEPRKSLRERLLGQPVQIDKEVYVPGFGFTNESKLKGGVRELVKRDWGMDDDNVDDAMATFGVTELTLEPQVARSAINAVKQTADAEKNVRRFAAIWEDLTIRLPFTDTRLPVPALDPLISLIPGVGEVVDGVLPTGVFLYNGVKAGLGAKALATGTALQMGNFALHILKYGGPTIVVKFVVDWMFNSVTATTHDFTKRRQQAIGIAIQMGITEEDIGKVSKEAIRRSTVTEENTQNSRLLKRRLLEGAWSYLQGKSTIAGEAAKVAGHHGESAMEGFLDYFYPLTEDRKAAEETSELRASVKKLAAAAGKAKAHGKDEHGKDKDKGHGHEDEHAAGDGHDHGHDHK